MKTRLNVCVDMDVYLAAKAQGINLSNVMNNALRTLIGNQPQQNARLQQQKDKLDKAEAEIAKLRQQLLIDTTEAMKRLEEDKKIKIEKRKKAMSMVKTIKASGILGGHK